MAIIKKEDLPLTLDSRTQLPRNRYQIRCTKDERTQSKKGAQMSKRDWEITTPTTKINGADVAIAGSGFTTYTVFSSIDEDGNVDEAKTATILKNAIADLEKVGLYNPDTGLDTDNIPSMEGVVADAILSAEEYSPRLNPTPEELSKGIKQGAIIKDGSGKNIVNYKVKMDSLLGLASIEDAASANTRP